MNTGQVVAYFKKPANKVDWKLLVFLILIIDVKLVVKLVAIIFIYILKPDLQFKIRLKNSRLPIFYLAVIIIACLNLVKGNNFTSNYISVALFGLTGWIVALLCIHQLKLFVESNDIQTLKNTLFAFFLINIVCSFGNLASIFFEIGLRNPFLYQGQYQKYFLNTGDYIRGVSFDTSTTNAIISCFGVIYFLYIEKYLMLLACMLVLLLTASNFSNLLLFAVFIFLFIFRSTRLQKSFIIICVMMLITFFTKVSPQNNHYAEFLIKKFLFQKPEDSTIHLKAIPLREIPDSQLSDSRRKEKKATLFLDSLERIQLEKTEPPFTGFTSATALVQNPGIPEDSIHTPSFQWKRDTSMAQKELLDYDSHTAVSLNTGSFTDKIPGKVQSFNQSFSYLFNHPGKSITGLGMGKFSSKLAFRATGLNIAGGFPKRCVYSDTAFLENHFALYSFFFTKNAEAHSLIHNPASVYDQLLTEYGIIGLASFVIFYLGFFLKDFKKLTYGLPMIAIVFAAFFTDYWFEQLSIVVLFELIILIDLQENKKNSVKCQIF